MPDSLNMRDLAEQYGFAYAMLKSNPELTRLFRNAIGPPSWTPERITAEVRNTKWYRQNSETQRNAEALKASDPATYAAQMQAQKVRVSMMAVEYGARLSHDRLASLTQAAYTGGWDDNQIRRMLARYIRYTDGRLLGQAGAMESDWREYAGQMGVAISSKQIRNWAQMATVGRMTPQDALSAIKEQAKSKYVALAKRIDQGETVEAIAAPYVQSYAEILEANPEAVNIQKSPFIQRALQDRDEKGNPRVQTIYEFEQKLRKSDAWKKTDNAQDSLMEVGRKVLQDFGLGE